MYLRVIISSEEIFKFSSSSLLVFISLSETTAAERQTHSLSQASYDDSNVQLQGLQCIQAVMMAGFRPVKLYVKLWVQYGSCQITSALQRRNGPQITNDPCVKITAQQSKL